MAQAIRRNTKKPQLTVGQLAKPAIGAIAGLALSWAMFAAAFKADQAVAQAAASIEATTTVQTMSGSLTARRIACAETGEGC